MVTGNMHKKVVKFGHEVFELMIDILITIFYSLHPSWGRSNYCSVES